MKLAVVIPAYNEARTIRDVATRALAACPLVAVVDDGSGDRTGDALSGLPLTLLRHARNRGKADALRTGFAWALSQCAEAIVTLDGDGQHRPEDIHRLASAARRHPGRIVIAARLAGRDSYPRVRNWANRFSDFWVSWAAGHRIVDSQSGQRIYPAALLRRVPLDGLAARFAFETDLVIRAAGFGFTTVAVPITAIYDASGRPSHFRPVRDFVPIGGVVARALFRSWMNVPGLWRSLRERPYVVYIREEARSSAIAAERRPDPSI